VPGHFVGPALGLLFVIVAVAAQCLIFNSYIASGSRGFFALAEDKLAPNVLVKVDKKHGVPYVAVISVAVVNIALCMIPFKTLIVVDVFLLISSYILVYISAMILRKRLPASDYKFRIPGGFGFLVVLCVVPMIIAFASFLINGTDYFIGGMLGIITGPILYAVWKWMKGGLAKKDPEKHPLNLKTKLAIGDMNRMAILFGILCVVGIVGCLFLPWYEGDWAMDYYPDEYADVPFMFWTVDLGFFQDWALMIKTIKIGTIVSGALTVIFFILGRVLEPKKKAA
jgi:amino acid transporter